MCLSSGKLKTKLTNPNKYGQSRRTHTGYTGSFNSPSELT